MMTSVLLVGEELRMPRGLRAGLLTLECQLFAAPDGASGLEMAARHVPDLVVLDLDLPDMAGTDVIAGLRLRSKVPIIALRDAGAASDVIEVLDAGADDCVTAPFEPDVLMARMRALRRRARDAAPLAEQRVLIGHHSLDLSAKTATRCADAPGDAPTQVHLTRTEWAILEVLVRNPGTVVTGRRLTDLVWGPSHPQKTDHLRFHIAKLRAKLEPEPSDPRQLITEPGIGYRFQP